MMAQQNEQNAFQRDLVNRFVHSHPVPSIDEINNSSIKVLTKVKTCGCTHLRHAVRSGAPFEVVKLLIERAPGSLSITNKRGNAVLSCIGENTQPEVGRLVAERAPLDAMLQLDNDGDLPLHCMIQNRAPNEVIQILIQRSIPEVFDTANKYGQLPLHEAVRYAGLDVDTFRLLLDRSPVGAMETTDKRGNLPIHYLSTMASHELADFVIAKSLPCSLSQANVDGQLPLHCAVVRGVSLQAIQSLIEKSPAEAMSIKDNNGQLPIHMIGTQLTSDAIRALVSRSSSDALIKPDSRGRLPIHCLLEKRYSRNATVDILTYLIDQAPQDCLSVADNDGFLPLHTAIRCRSPIEVIELLVQRSSSNIMTRADKRGRIPIMLAASNVMTSLEIIQLLSRKTPHEALLRPDQNGQSLMHWLTNRRDRAGVVAYLVETAPELLTQADATGKLPIHSYFAQSRRHFESVQALIGGSPESLLTADRDGRLPLHYASSFAPANVVKLLTDHPSCYVALQTADEKGQLPLHHAVSNKASIEVIELLVDNGPAAMSHFDNDGHLPLYYAVANTLARTNRFRRYRSRLDRPSDPSRQLNTVKILAERHPEMLAVFSPQGRLPLHDALELGVELPILKVLLQAYPGAAKRLDDNGRLPLHYAVVNHLPWESFKFILDAFPGAVCRSDLSGKIPLFIACHEDASLDKVFSLMLLNPDLLVFPPS